MPIPGCRYLRLTPLYAFILFFYAFVGPQLGSGPVWYRMHRDAELCLTHYWSNLYYVNKFVRRRTPASLPQQHPHRATTAAAVAPAHAGM